MRKLYIENKQYILYDRKGIGHGIRATWQFRYIDISELTVERLYNDIDNVADQLRCPIVRLPFCNIVTNWLTFCYICNKNPKLKVIEGYAPIDISKVSINQLMGNMPSAECFEFGKGEIYGTDC